MKLILIGFMGSGKSTVGKLLGQRHSLPVIDLDQAIEEAASQTIPAIFATHGETYFRKLEHQVLATVIDQPGILATGGGTPLRADNQALLQNAAVPIIHLRANAKETLSRLGNTQNRPLAKGLDQAGIEALKKQRHQAYQACANYTIETNLLSPMEVALAIEARVPF